MCEVSRMSMLEAMKRDYVYLGSPIYVLFGKYEPHSKEYTKATLYLGITDIDTPWVSSNDTGEIFWGSWSRCAYKNRIRLLRCLK